MQKPGDPFSAPLSPFIFPNATLSVLMYVFMAILLCPPPLAAKVYKRVHADGSVEYYNDTRPAITPSPAGRNLSSKYDAMIDRLSSLHGVDPRLVKCIIKVESNFNTDAVSAAGAMGLMQIMQETADYYFLDNPFNPEKNVETGIRHLKSLLVYFKNDVPLSLAAYHAGLGRVKKSRSLPPIQSTISYVNSVMRLYTGKADYSEQAVKRLYKRIERDGTIVIYSR